MMEVLCAHPEINRDNIDNSVMVRCNTCGQCWDKWDQDPMEVVIGYVKEKQS